MADVFVFDKKSREIFIKIKKCDFLYKKTSENVIFLLFLQSKM